jgi:DNA-binding CsgD family transcriptional regulator
MTGMQQESINGSGFPRATRSCGSGNEGSIPVPIDPEAVWQALSAVPGIGVCVVDTDGNCVYSSPESMRIYTGDENFDTTGISLYELFPKEWADERMGYIRRVVESGEPLSVRQVWRGSQICMVMRPVFDTEERVSHILVLSRPMEAMERCCEDQRVAESEFIELGELSVLTPRELVVLALLGQGLTLKEIAEKLHRSFKTIDNHRASIGRKLRKTDRLALAKLAAQAGLRVHDAELKRISPKIGQGERA